MLYLKIITDIPIRQQVDIKNLMRYLDCQQFPAFLANLLIDLFD